MERRPVGRGAAELRPVAITPDFTEMAPGSVLMRMGRTAVLCTVSLEERVPAWLRGQGRGWVSAEYALLPGSTPTRTAREAVRGRQQGRTVEIQRLIGRALRSVVDLERLGEHQLVVDCDVLQADGGTRTAAITGGFLALERALERLAEGGLVQPAALTGRLAAVSVGVVDGEPLLDLDYDEDSRADVDMNVVMTDGGRYVEVQGAAEGAPFAKATLVELLKLAERGIGELLERGPQLA
ncbi:ribonuclease PH [Acidimicrobium ferrooxidans DSM 10331]|uniref:Ribonuclease PH n=1 Tax=Acidimicrobium ferrooxidans (strain DSM 10331 / JCM 15462 / NBRC 103882 / ICP) TaxID=525909 RepID=C7M109_ACIFD|nr:ribonuclease PH [Acidimicrobium ferrooxidans]ACU54667.1 ribonuclease PH [Acidimicrobium ferrooxidans DSM 10331]